MKPCDRAFSPVTSTVFEKVSTRERLRLYGQVAVNALSLSLSIHRIKLGEQPRRRVRFGID